MKKILVSLSLFAGLGQVYAGDCVQDICLRDIVIDSGNHIGEVSSFETNVNGTKINFIETSSGYTYTSTFEKLSKKIIAPRFPEGSFVLDSSKHIGPVKSAFANGKVLLQEESTGHDYVSNNVVPEVAEYSGIAKNKYVIDGNDRYGKTLHVFEQGQTQFQEEGSGYTYLATQATAEAASLDGLAKGVVAIDSHNRVGKVVVVFKNGKAVYLETQTEYKYISTGLSAAVAVLENGLKPGMVTIDSRDRVGTVLHTFANQKAQYQENATGYSYVDSSPSPEVSELEGLSKGVVAIDSNNRIGKISYAFANGKALYVEISTGYSYISASLKNEVPKFGEVTTKTRIIDSNNRIGITNFVFEDGRIQYTEASTGYAYITNKQSPEVNQLGTLKADLVVLDESGRVGKITSLFKNGSIVHQELSSGYQYIVTSVSPEVDSHDTYNKSDDYSSISYRVGKVKRFFANKKVEFSADGYSFVVTELFSQVDEFKSYLPEQKIIDVQGDEGTIKKIFANGAILYEAKKKLAGDDEPKLHTLSAKIFGANEKELDADQTNWITGLAHTLSDGSFFPILRYNAQVIKEEDYTDLKTDLLEYLKKHDDIIHDQKLRKKVLKYLGGTDGDDDDNNTSPTVKDVVSINVNDAAYRSTLEKLLTKKKIKYEFSATEELKAPSLVVTITKLKTTLFVHKCLVQMRFSGENHNAQANINKTTWSLKKNACDAVVKKAFNVLSF